MDFLYQKHDLRQVCSLFLFCLLCLTACEQDQSKSKEAAEHLFTNIPVTESGVNFRNSVEENNMFNFINYIYIYNGGGVAIEDFNNDGWKDIYFTSNQSSNKLFLNKGDFEFDDVTSNYGVADAQGWTTGVSVVDINNDGWKDIYVCKSGSNDPNLRRNKLFINQKGKSFVDMAAQYGIDDASYSNQAYWFDYDKDGDLDLYVVNHRSDWNNTIVYNPQTESVIEPYMSDRLFQNQGQRFIDVSQQAGIQNKTWGQSAAIHDFNGDGWDDIFVCNDFIQGDQLWINNQQGGFSNQVDDHFDHISFFSMGSDVADINNDDKADLVVLDMVSEDHVSSKRLMAAMSTSQFHLLVGLGNHYQYMTNILQLNRGEGQYSQVAYTSGIANTDWSWAPLIADFDNDGYKDLYISNGIKRDMTDNDFKIALEKRAQEGYMNIEDVFQMIPSRKVGNYFFKNKGNTTFENRSSDFNVDYKTNSNGAAYGDLDNDGDLDLVVNNLEDYASIYRNNASGNYLKVKLKGPANNASGIGTKLVLTTDEGKQTLHHYLVRGYQSSVADEEIFGLKNLNTIQSLEVFWPDGKYQKIENLKVNKTVELNHADAQGTSPSDSSSKGNRSFVKDNKLKGLFKHQENEFDDFAREILLPQKYSTIGPRSSVGDVNGDGLEDIFFSGAKGQAASLLVQKENGSFTEVSKNAWEKDARYEDIGSVFIDGDLDGDLDLYVTSGGNESPAGDELYTDRYYVNDGSGNYRRSDNIPTIRESGGKVLAADFDADGDEDLLVCGRSVPGKYPMPPSSYLLQNNGGTFKDVSSEMAPGLKEIGMVTDAMFTDYDNDGDLDLMITGEWMGLVILENNEMTFSQKDISNITGSGWWYSIAEGDFNNDGNKDYVLGNLGLNNKFGVKQDKIFHVFCNDFDESGNLDIVLSKEKSGKFLPVRGRECSSQQMPFIKEKFETYKAFAEADLTGIYGEEKIESALHYSVNNFASVVLIADGKGGFKSQNLPIEAQYGPSLSLLVEDLNKDGNLDVIGAGNIYNSEVETVRYDANKGYVLLGDGQGGFEYDANSGLLTDGNVKQISFINIADQKHLLVVKNDDEAESFRIQI